jgi:hypothetical protein
MGPKMVPDTKTGRLTVGLKFILDLELKPNLVTSLLTNEIRGGHIRPMGRKRRLRKRNAAIVSFS